MRQIVRASLPLGLGTVLDPFMGSGATNAAAAFVGYDSIGIETDPEYFRLAERAIPALAGLPCNGASLTGALWQPGLFAEGAGAYPHQEGH